MAKQLIVLLAVAVGMSVADDSGYGAPSAQSYAASAPSYGAPSAPASDYGAPADIYGAPQQYGEPASGYSAPSAPSDDGGDLFKFDKLLELLPFFLAVFAAIILAQLLAPLLNMLPGIFAPFGNVKIDFINLLLQPFNLAVCNTNTNPLTIAGTPSGRGLAGMGFFGNPETVDQITNSLFEAVKMYQELA
jgi:hypothetical protein